MQGIASWRWAKTLAVTLGLVGLATLSMAAADARPKKQGPVRNGNILFITTEALLTVDPDGKGRRKLLGEPVSGASFSPDGRLLAFGRHENPEGGDSDIFIARADGSGFRRIVGGRLDDRYPVFTPNGKRIVFERGDLNVVQDDVHRDLYSVTTSGKRLKQLTETPEGERTAAISPNGRWIAYTRFDFREFRNPKREQIWVMRADGSGQRPLSLPQPNTTPFDVGTAFSGDLAEFTPSGRRVVFQCPGGICVINRDGSGQRMLIGDPVDPATGLAPRGVGELTPKFAPDGRRIAYAAAVSNQGSNRTSFQIRVAKADGSGVRILEYGSHMEVLDWQRKPGEARKRRRR